MFGWFRNRRAKARLQPEARWVVDVTALAISATDHTGVCKRVAKADLSRVIIETNDSGPWGADVWWLLFGPDEMLACAWPQGATGEPAVLDYVLALPGFDYAQMAVAMGSTANRMFPVWRKVPAEDSA